MIQAGQIMMKKNKCSHVKHFIGLCVTASFVPMLAWVNLVFWGACWLETKKNPYVPA